MRRYLKDMERWSHMISCKKKQKSGGQILKSHPFLQSEQFSDIAVLGLSMGGIFAVRALEEESVIGGGFSVRLCLL